MLPEVEGNDHKEINPQVAEMMDYSHKIKEEIKHQRIKEEGLIYVDPLDFLVQNKLNSNNLCRKPIIPFRVTTLNSQGKDLSLELFKVVNH